MRPGHPESKLSASDEWWTLQELYDELCKKYNFYPELDVSATKANRLCNYYFSKKDDALTRDWIKGKKKRFCWNNPPAKEQGKFIAKAYEQWDELRIKTMQIVPLNVQSSNAWWDNVLYPIKRGERIFTEPIKNRRKFLYKGRDVGGSINGYCVVIYGRKQKCYDR